MDQLKSVLVFSDGLHTLVLYYDLYRKYRFVAVTTMNLLHLMTKHSLHVNFQAISVYPTGIQFRARSVTNAHND